MSDYPGMHDQPDNSSDQQNHQERLQHPLLLHIVRDQSRNDVTDNSQVLVDIGKKEKTFFNEKSEYHAEKHSQHEPSAAEKYDFSLKQLDQATGGHGQKERRDDPERLFEIEREISRADQPPRKDSKEFRTQEAQQYADGHG
jgi:hypothetical protein